MKKIVLLFFVIGFLVSCSQRVEMEDPKENSDSLKTDVSTENKIAGQSDITCPKCGFKKTETMPTDVCLLKYTCTGCRAVLEPKESDCCVFCSYGTEKCPSKQ